METRFDEAAYRQRLIDKGTDPATATDIAAKMAASRRERANTERTQARAAAEEEARLRALEGNGRGPLPVGRSLPGAAVAAAAPAAPPKPAATPTKKPRQPAARAAEAVPAKAVKRARKTKGVQPVPPEAFANQQLVLFQSFLANDDAQRDLLSNAIDLWDSIPRYSISRRKQEELRQAGGYLPIRKQAFHYRGMPLTAVIRPARLERCDNQGKPTGGTVEYYPSAREELVEQALRRLATEKAAGFFDDTAPRSGLFFTLYRLRQELAAQGHAMTHRELAESLDILSLSSLDIETEGGGDALGLGKFTRNTFLVNLAGVKREDLDRNPEARWYTEFHPFVTVSIDNIAYRQFNYNRWMRGRTQVTRWLISQLVLKYTQASAANSFVMKFSTIKRDSGLLEGYKLQRQAVAALDEAFDELVQLGVLRTFTRDEERGARSKLEDVRYTLHPSRAFAQEQRAANKRQLDAKAEASEHVEALPDPQQPPLL
jgi:hypothetical protein